MPSAILVESEVQAVSSIVEPKEQCLDTAKGTACAFNINDIPSPTRSRAKKQQWTTPVETEEDASCQSMCGGDQLASFVQDTGVDKGLGLDSYHAAFLARKDAEARWNIPEAAVTSKQEEADHEEAARIQQLKDKADAERFAMDKVCMETFLESVNCVAWRERVRTPIKGSNLYTKHIRPCRLAGTSVDVKDSNFTNLGSFLTFLESEGLIQLKPGLSDPVVTEVRFDACRKYKYTGRQLVASNA